MLPFDITMNIIVLFAIIAVSALFGFGFRRGRLAKKNSRIRQLEQEMIETHAEILELQKEFCELESRSGVQKIPQIKGTSSNRQDRPTRTAS
jgi:hypothetical protein